MRFLHVSVFLVLGLMCSFIGAQASLGTMEMHGQTMTFVLPESTVAIDLYGLVQYASDDETFLYGCASETCETSVSIVMRHDAVFGTITDNGNRYVVASNPLGDGFIVRKLRNQDPSLGHYDVDHPPVSRAYATEHIEQSPSHRVERVHRTTYIDIGVQFTPEVLEYFGSRQVINIYSEFKIGELNTAMENSGIDFVRFRYVGAEPSVYVQPAHGTILQDVLSWVYEEPGETHSGVNAFRDRSGADIVVVLVTNFRGYCGWAYYFHDAPSALSVVSVDCATQNIFQHEIGHNLGCGHNPENQESFSIVSYDARGLYVPGSFRTIMSYENVCGTDTCDSVLYFSNPEIIHNGHPTGVIDMQNNARSIVENAYAISQFRPSRIDERIYRSARRN